MKVAARTSPNMPSASTVAGIATANQTGCTGSSGTSKKTAPQTSVATSEYRPAADVASATPSSTAANGGGVVNSTSSVPDQRSRCSAIPAPASVDDQRPMIPAASAIQRTASWFAPPSYMKNAIVAYTSGIAIRKTTVEVDFRLDFRWKRKAARTTSSDVRITTPRS